MWITSQVINVTVLNSYKTLALFIEFVFNIQNKDFMCVNIFFMTIPLRKVKIQYSFIGFSTSFWSFSQVSPKLTLQLFVHLCQFYLDFSLFVSVPSVSVLLELQDKKKMPQNVRILNLTCATFSCCSCNLHASSSAVVIGYIWHAFFCFL